MTNVISFGGITKNPLPVERVLMSDTAMTLTEVLVIGYNPDGTLHLAMSEPELERALMLLELASGYIMREAMAITELSS